MAATSERRPHPKVEAAITTDISITRRRCEGTYCWCHVGADVVVPITHEQAMADMARRIRAIEIRGGVLGALGVAS
jgi:hypothetical protein